MKRKMIGIRTASGSCIYVEIFLKLHNEYNGIFGKRERERERVRLILFSTAAAKCGNRLYERIQRLNLN